MKLLKIIICSMLPLISFSQTMNKEVRAKIEVSYSEDLVLIKGTAENLTNVSKSISYKLSVIKNEDKPGNQSTNSQSGRETLEPQKSKDLSKTQINIGKEDEIVLLLSIYDEKGIMIGENKVTIPEK